MSRYEWEKKVSRRCQWTETAQNETWSKRVDCVRHKHVVVLCWMSKIT